MDNTDFERSRQVSAGMGTSSQNTQNIPLLPLLLGLVLILVLLAVSIVNTMTVNRMESRLEQLEERLTQLETQLTQMQEEQQAAQETADAEIPENTSAPVKEESGLRSIAHRGFSAKAPENTLPSFLLAWQRGFHYVEADIQFTADGCPVLLHDLWIDRTSNGSGRIDWMTLDQVRQYDFGSWMSA